jgi:hypothetical protein
MYFNVGIGIREAGADMTREKRNTISEHDLRKIAEFIESIQYGSVSIVIQDGAIVQIEKNEKLRMK